MKTRFFALALLVGLAGSLRATVIAVSNLGQPTASTTYAIGKSVPAFDFQAGVSFTTGATALDLESVTLSFFSRNGLATDFNVSLYSGLTAAGPSGLLTTFAGNSTPSAGLETYTPNAPTTLLANTTYWLVESSVLTAPLTGFSLVGTNSLAEDAGGLPGWSIGDSRMVTNNGGASWFAASPTSGVLKFSVQGASTVPDTGATALLLALSLLGLVGAKRRLALAA